MDVLVVYLCYFVSIEYNGGDDVKLSSQVDMSRSYTNLAISTCNCKGRDRFVIITWWCG